MPIFWRYSSSFSVTEPCNVPLLTTPQSSQLAQFSLSVILRSILSRLGIRMLYAKTVLSLSISSDSIWQSYAISDAALNHSISFSASDGAHGVVFSKNRTAPSKFQPKPWKFRRNRTELVVHRIMAFKSWFLSFFSCTERSVGAPVFLPVPCCPYQKRVIWGRP